MDLPCTGSPYTEALPTEPLIQAYPFTQGPHLRDTRSSWGASPAPLRLLQPLCAGLELASLIGSPPCLRDTTWSRVQAFLSLWGRERSIPSPQIQQVGGSSSRIRLAKSRHGRPCLPGFLLTTGGPRTVDHADDSLRQTKSTLTKGTVQTGEKHHPPDPDLSIPHKNLRFLAFSRTSSKSPTRKRSLPR